GPNLLWAGAAPRTQLKPVWPGDELPAGLPTLHDGRRRMATPPHLPRVGPSRALIASVVGWRHADLLPPKGSSDRGGSKRRGFVERLREALASARDPSIVRDVQPNIRLQPTAAVQRPNPELGHSP